MRNSVLKFGFISGVIMGGLMAATVPFYMNGGIDFDHGHLIGYSSMVLSFLLVYFGIRSYRDEVGGGAIGFGRAFAVGILITAVSCAFYVLAWEIVYFNFFPDFVDQYTAHTLGKMRAAGETQAAIAAMEVKMAQFARLYANPLINVLMTFVEPLPVGLIVTLVSAAILRRKPGQGGVPATAAG